MNPSRRAIALRLLAAWLMLSVLGFWLGPRCLEAFGPALTEGIRQLAPGLTSRISVEPGGSEVAVVLEAQVATPLVLDGVRSIPTGTPIHARINAIHALVPVVILLSVSCAIPAAGWRDRALGLVLAVPLAVALAWLILLLHLLGLVELQIQMTAEQLGIVREPGPLLNLLLFLEGGGRWLLPALLGLLPAAMLRRRGRSPAGQ